MFSHWRPRETAQAPPEAHGQVRGQHPRGRGGRERAADCSGQVRVEPTRDFVSIRSSPSYGLSTPCRLPIRNSARR